MKCLLLTTSRRRFTMNYGFKLPSDVCFFCAPRPPCAKTINESHTGRGMHSRKRWVFLFIGLWKGFCGWISVSRAATWQPEFSVFSACDCGQFKGSPQTQSVEAVVKCRLTPWELVHQPPNAQWCVSRSKQAAGRDYLRGGEIKAFSCLTLRFQQSSSEYFDLDCY